MELTSTIVINRPIDEVFDVATCLRRCLVWRAIIVATEKVTPGPVDIGTEYRHKVHLFGRTFETRPIIIHWEPPYRSEYNSPQPPVSYYVKFTCDEVAGGTRFTSTVHTEFLVPILSHIAQPLFERAMQRQYEADLQTLKALMEGEMLITVE